MSYIPKAVLLNFFPRAGFRWRRGQGSPRILRSGRRDDVVRRAVRELLGGGDMDKRSVQDLVVTALVAVTTAINDPSAGIRPSEGIIDFLERSAQLSALGQALPEDIWVELVYQIADARARYKRHTSAAEQEGDRDQLTALAHAIDDLVRAAGKKWDWSSLEFYAYPHLMGEDDLDYEVDEEEDDDDDDAASANKKPEEDESMEDSAGEELPRRMEQLDIQDVDGDVEMGM